MQPQCPKLRNHHVAAVREVNSEEIIKVIEENLKEDAKDNASEEEDLNKNSDEMYSWDEINVRFLHFIKVLTNHNRTLTRYI